MSGEYVEARFDVFNDGTTVAIQTDVEDFDIIVEGLLKARAAYELIGDWKKADELAEIIDELNA